MPAMPTSQADAYPTPPDSSQLIEPGKPTDADPTPLDSSQTTEPEGGHDMHYYLTEGLEGAEHYEYRDIRSLKAVIDLRADNFRAGKADESLLPYVIFSPVTRHQLDTINNVRKTHYKKLRILYLNQPQVLIVKHMPSPIHEMAAKMFERIIVKKIDEGGQGAMIIPMGSTTYEGFVCGKEPDGSLRPCLARPGHSDWPTVVLECGVSETARRLIVDGHWWIDNSNGAVKIVLLFFVSVRYKTIRIELWTKDTVEKANQTRFTDKEQVTGPTLKKSIKITANSVTGSPLKLRFRDIFLRGPKAKRGEGNYTITEDDMRGYYQQIWPPEPEVNSQDESSTEEKSASSTSSHGYIHG